MKLADCANALPFHAKTENCELTQPRLDRVEERGRGGAPMDGVMACQRVLPCHRGTMKSGSLELAWQETFPLVIQLQTLVGGGVDKLERERQARVGGCRGEVPLHPITARFAQQGLAPTIRPQRPALAPGLAGEQAAYDAAR